MQKQRQRGHFKRAGKANSLLSHAMRRFRMNIAKRDLVETFYMLLVQVDMLGNCALVDKVSSSVKAVDFFASVDFSVSFAACRKL